MKIQVASHYRKPGGLIMFVYIVLGTIIELAKYKEAQGANYRENEQGVPLFFSNRPLTTSRSEKIDLIITANGKVVVDDLNKILNQEAQYENCLIQERAKLAAKIATGNGGIGGLADLTSNNKVATEAEVEEVIATASVQAGEALPV